MLKHLAIVYTTKMYTYGFHYAKKNYDKHGAGCHPGYGVLECKDISSGIQSKTFLSNKLPHILLKNWRQHVSLPDCLYLSNKIIDMPSQPRTKWTHGHCHENFRIRTVYTTQLRQPRNRDVCYWGPGQDCLPTLSIMSVMMNDWIDSTILPGLQLFPSLSISNLHLLYLFHTNNYSHCQFNRLYISLSLIRNIPDKLWSIL